MHAELRIGNSRFMVNDAMMGSKAPRQPRWLAVVTVDLRRRRRRALQPCGGGGREGASRPDGGDAGSVLGDRCGSVKDPEGYTWTIATHKEDLTPQELDKRQAEWMKNFAAHQPAHS